MTKLGKLWTGAVAYVSLMVGAGLSVAGNLADTYRTRGVDVDGLDKVMAAGWPILVLLAIEMFVSPRWSERRLFQAWRWLGCLGVGGMAMTVSWTHLHDLMASRGQLPAVAILGPLAIDGMAIMATGLILSTRVRGQVDTDTPQPIKLDMSAVRVSDTDMDRMAKKLDSLPDGPMSVDMSATDTDISGYRRWADLPGTDKSSPNLMDWVDGQKRARADIGDSLATEASAYLSTVTDAEPLPKRERAAGTSYPADLPGYLRAWEPGKLDRADLVKLLAGHYACSERTVRRWLAAYGGQPASGPPIG